MAIETAPVSLSGGQYETATGVFLLDPLGNPLGTSATYPLYVTGGTGGGSSSGGGGGAVTQSTGAGATAPWSVEITNGSAFNSAAAPLYVSVTNTSTSQTVADTNSAPFQGEFAMTPGTAYTPGRSFKANCTAAGIVSMTYPDGSPGLWQLVVGIQTIPAAATMINSSGTTATATYTGLK